MRMWEKHRQARFLHQLKLQHYLGLHCSLSTRISLPGRANMIADKKVGFTVIRFSNEGEKGFERRSLSCFGPMPHHELLREEVTCAQTLKNWNRD